MEEKPVITNILDLTANLEKSTNKADELLGRLLKYEDLQKQYNDLKETIDGSILLHLSQVADYVAPLR